MNEAALFGRLNEPANVVWASLSERRAQCVQTTMCLSLPCKCHFRSIVLVWKRVALSLFPALVMRGDVLVLKRSRR